MRPLGGWDRYCTSLLYSGAHRERDAPWRACWFAGLPHGRQAVSLWRSWSKLGRLPGKRKVGGSTPPLTTKHCCFDSPLTCAYVRRIRVGTRWAVTVVARERPPGADSYRTWIARTGFTSLEVREREASASKSNGSAASGRTRTPVPVISCETLCGVAPCLARSQARNGHDEGRQGRS